MAARKSANEQILVIDAGTQSIRVSAVDLRGNIRDIIKTPIEPYVSDYPGWAEQDPEYYWKVLKKTCRRFFRETRISKDSIKGVTLTTQRNTMVNLDEKGKPLRPAIVWLDRRSARVESWPSFPMSLALRAVNMLESVKYSIRESEANWIRQNQPDIWEKTHKFLFLSGYFVYKLTDQYIDSSGSQVGYVPFDFKNQTWAPENNMYWKMFPIDPDKLSALVKPTELLGYITPSAARETGIPKGLPLMAAATDKACEVLGSGCLSPEIGCLSYGTTATVNTTTKDYVEVIPFIPPYPSAVPGWYSTEIQIYRGYWMVSWFKREFGEKEQRIAEKRGIAPEKLFDEMIRDIPPGSMGLTLQPYWSPGVKVPGLEAKGAIIGFGDVHSRAHIYRSILEGLAYALKEGLEKTEKRNKVPVEKLRVSGGGSQSDVAMQITADIFGLSAERPHTFETSTLGAAMDAAVGLKLHPDFDQAVSEMTRVGRVFEPDSESSRMYNELYEKVYLKLYDRLKPLYDEIRDITGYPAKIDD
jgi:sugar (pentulose or hexulose) kinase